MALLFVFLLLLSLRPFLRVARRRLLWRPSPVAAATVLWTTFVHVYNNRPYTHTRICDAYIYVYSRQQKKMVFLRPRRVQVNNCFRGTIRKYSVRKQRGLVWFLILQRDVVIILLYFPYGTIS